MLAGGTVPNHREPQSSSRCGVVRGRGGGWKGDACDHPTELARPPGALMLAQHTVASLYKGARKGMGKGKGMGTRATALPGKALPGKGKDPLPPRYRSIHAQAVPAPKGATAGTYRFVPGSATSTRCCSKPRSNRPRASRATSFDILWPPTSSWEADISTDERKLLKQIVERWR
ncbi:hypothetical protein D9M69_578000 [compost metagenome]